MTHKLFIQYWYKFQLFAGESRDSIFVDTFSLYTQEKLYVFNWAEREDYVCLF